MIRGNMLPKDLFKRQQIFFRSGQSLQVDFRRQGLKRLRTLITKYESGLLEAIYKDLHKSKIESYTCEIGFVLNEIDYTLKHLYRWTKPVKSKTPWLDWPGKSLLYPEPKGLVLIIAPWNYPFLLIMSPLIGALAAGNCVVLKPTEFAPHTSKVLENLIRECFPDEYCCVVQGDTDIAQQLLDNPWAHIFFTGSTSIGKHIMKSAAKYLSPVTLELGGKNPCIVMEDSDISISAQRIAWGKFLNAGQTCVAPDYLLVHKNIEDQLIAALKKTIHKFYGSDPQTSPDFARIINHRHFDRLINCLEGVKILFGGHYDRDDLYISPTLISDIRSNECLMQEEIFGPVLPVLTFDNIEELIKDLQARPKPLALYLFTKNKFWQEQVCARLSSGSIAINETQSQISNLNLPFGGVGESGMGAYHGRASFDCFSHYKGILIKGYRYHNKLRYPPYKVSLPQIKKIFKIIIR